MVSLPHPCIPGANAIGRVAALSPDTTSLTTGNLVLLDSFVRARDDPWGVQILWGATDGASPSTKHLYANLCRDGCFAEYVLAPLENTHRLDKARLLGDPRDGGLGYAIPELLQMAPSTIVYGGLRVINLQAGERIIVYPATGATSGVAAAVAQAMGANVVAASRSATSLAALKAVFPAAPGRREIETVVMTGDVGEDTASLRAFGPVYAVIDVSPPAATGTLGVRAAVMALRAYGRVSLMGGRGDDNLPFPWPFVLANNIAIRGQFMFERQDAKDLVKMVEAGVLRLGRAAGHEVVGEFALEEWEAALAVGGGKAGYGQTACIVP